MTSEQIESMEAGPEMDQSVASACGIDQPSLPFDEWLVALNDKDPVWKRLTNQEKTIVQLRRGIGGNQEPFTLLEVGRMFKCTRERVRQIETRCIERLKPSWRRAAFLPSTDWTDAMSAAERFGLFNNYRVLRMNRHDWEVMEIGDPLDRIVSNGPTGPLAICRAILNLHAGGDR